MAIPGQLEKLFWDTDWATIDPHRQRAFVLDRVLEYGGIEAVRWAERFYGLPQIAEYFEQRGDRVLSAKTRAFWRAVLAAAGTSCTTTSSAAPSNPLWPY